MKLYCTLDKDIWDFTGDRKSYHIHAILPKTSSNVIMWNCILHIQGLLEAYFKIIKYKNSGEQEKESIIRVRVGWEGSGSVVECWTRDRGAAGLSLTGITALCPWAKHINPSLVLVQPRKTCPFITEILLIGRKE